MARPNVNKIPDKLLIKLRSNGFSFGEIGLCAGVSRQAISEKLKSIAPQLVNLDAYADNERHYYMNEEMTALTLGGLLRDKAAFDLVNHDHVNTMAISASSKLTETALKIFSARRLLEGKSTSNQSHFSTHYRNAEKRKPVFEHPPVTDLSTLPPHTIDITPTPEDARVDVPADEPSPVPRSWPACPPTDGTMLPSASETSRTP